MQRLLIFALMIGMGCAPPKGSTVPPSAADLGLELGMSRAAVEARLAEAGASWTYYSEQELINAASEFLEPITAGGKIRASVFAERGTMFSNAATSLDLSFNDEARLEVINESVSRIGW